MTQPYFDHRITKQTGLSLLRKLIALVGLAYTPYYWASMFATVGTHCPKPCVSTSPPFTAGMVTAALMFGLGVALWRRLDDRLRGRAPIGYPASQ